MKLLLVEDDTFFAQLVKEYLSDNGIEADVVRTAAEAVNVDLDRYNGAIIDVMLPNDPVASGISTREARGGFLAGIAVARRFRQKVSDFPIVLLSSLPAGGEGRHWAKGNGVPFVRKVDDRSRLLSALHDLGLIAKLERPRAFIVHGHDETLLLELKNYLQCTLKWPEPIVLREQPNCGKTVIEKFEEYAGTVDWVFVLLSPDDKTFAHVTNEERRRARQNVIFELGFFYGLMGRHEGRVIVLKKGTLELPSDIQGMVWIDADDGVRACGEDIRREIGC